MDERMAPQRTTHLTRAALAAVILLISFGVGLACEFPDEHSITLNSAVINGTDITKVEPLLYALAHPFRAR
jgi:hypothetical protein